MTNRRPIIPEDQQDAYNDTCFPDAQPKAEVPKATPTPPAPQEQAASAKKARKTK